MKIVIIPDSFKESLESIEVARAIQEGWALANSNTDFELVPISDGGEGILATLLQVHDGKLCEVQVSHPLYGRDKIVDAHYAWIPRTQTIVIESAEAIGLDLVPRKLRNPLLTSSYGLGEILVDVHTKYIATGKADSIIIGIGGTSTVDGGMGMAQALGAKFFDEAGNILGQGGQKLHLVRSVDISSMLDMSVAGNSISKKIKIVVASDVQNPLLGVLGAVQVFAPQKGATPDMLHTLEQGMQNFAQVLANNLSLDMNKQINGVHAGAAGGLGMALPIFCKANVQSGIDLMIAQVGLENHLQGADLVITGEGRVDGQSLQGKVVFGIIQTCKKHNVPVCIIAGALDKGYETLYDYGVHAMFSATAISANWDEIKAHAYKNLVQVSRAVASMYDLGTIHEI